MKIVEIKSGLNSYSIVLPNPDIDYIQKYICRKKRPYEHILLEDAARHLKPGDLVLDIGANIGNHTLYFASLGCSVAAFEPNPELVSFLHKSIAVNHFDDRIAVHPYGLGKEESLAEFETENERNTGSQSLSIKSGGGIPVHVLDGLAFPQKIALMKIDVEGMELDVLIGGRALIQEHRPILYIECQDGKALRDIFEYVSEQNYVYRDTFNGTPTHKFIPSELVDKASIVVKNKKIEDTIFKERDNFDGLNEINLNLKRQSRRKFAKILNRIFSK